MTNRGILALALAVLTACSSTEPGPEPLPEPRGKLLVSYSGVNPDSSGLVIRDVASGRDTMIVKQAPGAPVYVGGRTSALPSRRSVAGLSPNGSAVREISLLDGTVTDLFTPPTGERVTQVAATPSGHQLAVMFGWPFGGPPQLVVVDLSTMQATVWWHGKVGDDVLVLGFEPVTGGLMLVVGTLGPTTEPGLYLVRGPGAALELVISSSEGVFGPCDYQAAPDGAIVYRGHDRELKMYRPPWVADGPAISPGILAYCPVFSPDGEFLAYGASGTGEGRIYRMRDGRITPLPAVWSGQLNSLYAWWYE